MAVAWPTHWPTVTWRPRDRQPRWRQGSSPPWSICRGTQPCWCAKRRSGQRPAGAAGSIGRSVRSVRQFLETEGDACKARVDAGETLPHTATSNHNTDRSARCPGDELCIFRRRVRGSMCMCGKKDRDCIARKNEGGLEGGGWVSHRHKQRGDLPHQPVGQVSVQAVQQAPQVFTPDVARPCARAVPQQGST